MKSEDNKENNQEELVFEIKESEYERYEINFDKVNDLDDVILVLKGLKLRVVNPLDHGLEDLMPYLKKVEE